MWVNGEVTMNSALSKDLDSVTTYQFGATISAAYDIVPNDTVDLANPTTQIYIGGAGDLKVDLLNAGTVTFKALPIGFHRIRAKRVYATGSTATSVVGAYYVPGGV